MYPGFNIGFGQPALTQFASLSALTAAVNPTVTPGNGLYYTADDGFTYAIVNGVFTPVAGTGVLGVSFDNLAAAATTVPAGAPSVAGVNWAIGATKDIERPVNTIWAYTPSQGVYGVVSSILVRIDYQVAFFVPVGVGDFWSWTLQSRSNVLSPWKDLVPLCGQGRTASLSMYCTNGFGTFRTVDDKEFRLVVRHDNAAARDITVTRLNVLLTALGVTQ